MKRVLQRIQRVCFELIDSQTCSPAVSVSIYMYLVDIFPNNLALRFLKSHCCSTYKNFSSGKNVLHNFWRWLQSVLAMYIVLAVSETPTRTVEARARPVKLQARPVEARARTVEA